MSSAGPTGRAGGTDQGEARAPRSALTDIAEQTVVRAGTPPADPVVPPRPAPEADAFTPAKPTTGPTAESATGPAEQLARLREFRVRLGQFRRHRVLVPYGENGAALTVETHALRWLLAFTDEAALGRYATARGEADRTWRYRTVWGAAVLDAGVPALTEDGSPCGVLVDAADGERGLVLPPVTGIVPEAVAVDGVGLDAGEGRS